MSTLVKEKTNSVKDALVKTGQDVGKKLAIASAYITCATTYAMTNTAFATQGGGTGGSADVADIVKSILGVIVNIFPFVGGFFIIAGVFKLIMAYRNDQPEAQAGAARDIVIGAVFVVFRAFVWNAISNVIFGKIK